MMHIRFTLADFRRPYYRKYHIDSMVWHLDCSDHIVSLRYTMPCETEIVSQSLQSILYTRRPQLYDTLSQDRSLLPTYLREVRCPGIPRRVSTLK